MLLRTLAVLALVVAPACKNSGSDPPSGGDQVAPQPGVPATQPEQPEQPATQPEQPEQPATPGASDCGGKTCAAGEQCIEYYGIAGPRGGKMYACGIPCADGKCPEGKTCRTIADGPGPVCQ